MDKEDVMITVWCEDCHMYCGTDEGVFIELNNPNEDTLINGLDVDDVLNYVRTLGYEVTKKGKS